MDADAALQFTTTTFTICVHYKRQRPLPALRAQSTRMQALPACNPLHEFALIIPPIVIHYSVVH